MTSEELMAERAAHQSEVAALLQAVADKVAEGVAAGLYPDGLTPGLDDASRLAPAMIAKIQPPTE